MTRRAKVAAGVAGAVAIFLVSTMGMNVARGLTEPPAALRAMAPCAAEDGPGPCFWDAGRAGNGLGFSFWIDCAQAFHYLDPAADARWGGPGGGPGGAYASTCAS